MIDLISDWNIDNLINWKTKETAINEMVWKIDENFKNKIEKLLDDIKENHKKIIEFVSNTDILKPSELISLCEILGFNVWKLKFEWKPYLWIIIPEKQEIYALVDWELKLCELEDIILWSNVSITNNTTTKKRNNSWEVSYSYKPGAITYNKTWVKFWDKKTLKYSKPLIDLSKIKIKGFISADIQQKHNFENWNITPLETNTVTGNIWASIQWLRIKMGKTTAKTNFTTLFSPRSISWDVSWGLENKNKFKWTLTENFWFNRGNLSISGIANINNFSEIKKSCFSAEMLATTKILEKVALQLQLKIDQKWVNYFWVSGSIPLFKS